jgi:hypothetical protein
MSVPLREESVTTPRRSTGLLVASRLCWIWGVICVTDPLGESLAELGAPTPEASFAIAMGYAIGYALLAATYCLAGSLIRRGRTAGGWIGVGIASIVAGVQLLGFRGDTEMTVVATASLALNLGILLLLVFNWRHLWRAPSRGAVQPPLPRAISTPSKVILGFCAVAAALGWFFLIYGAYFSLLFSLLLADAVLWALIDLTRLRNSRTLLDLGITVLGLVVVVVGVWVFYLDYSGAPGPSLDRTLTIRNAADQRIRIDVGQELDLTLLTVGAGQYMAPPSISSGALRFLDAQIVPRRLTSGSEQLFRFQGKSPGMVVVTIQHSGASPTIRDTVVVERYRSPAL